MLTRDPAQRITANNAVNHPWLCKYESTYYSKEEENENLIQSLRNLKNFGAETIFQKAVLSYIASQEIDPCEEKKLKHLFDTLDSDKSGQVTLDELLKGYTKVYNNRVKAHQTSLQILKKTDINNNGCIDYNGKVVTKYRVLDGHDGKQPDNNGRSIEESI